MVGFIDKLTAERERWVLWSPVLLGIGIGIYFSLHAEPPWYVGPLAAAGAMGIYGMAGRRPFPIEVVNSFKILAICIVVVTSGFVSAQWRTHSMASVVLTKTFGPTTVSGQIAQLERFPGNLRLTLDHTVINGLPRHRTPERVRIRVNGAQMNVQPGDWVRLRARMSPPPPPAAPGSFDFQRRFYFLGIGAVGFSIGRLTTIGAHGVRGAPTVAIAISKLRDQLTSRITAALPGRTGGIAAALMTGERSAIPKPVLSHMRDSGLAHLLAISGLHIGLVAGILFASFRAALALCASIALRYPIKKWAAAVAIIGAFGYAVIAGTTLPTQRAFLMVSIALLGVILDRRGLSLRSVAWAALVILLIQPESLLGASFQMSFAAVVALVAGYEWLAERRIGNFRNRALDHSPLSAPYRYVVAVAITTLIAGMTTAPFAVFHFNRFADFGLLANILAVPVTALWVMPCAIMSFLLMPFGGEVVALTPMGWGIELVIKIAKWVAELPGAVTTLPAMPVWALASVSLGGLWVCIWRRPWRLYGVSAIAAGLSALIFVQPPDILIDGNGRVVAIRTDDGEMMVSTRRRAGFQREVWTRLGGQDTEPKLLPATGRRASGALSCDIEGCIYSRGGLSAALVRLESALQEDCNRAHIVVSLTPIRGNCGADHVIDRFDLWRMGSHAVWFGDGDTRILTVNGVRGYRPWVVRPDIPPSPGH